MALRRLHMVAKGIHISPNIKNAVQENQPVVALESTIITHGMPYPHNYKTAIAVEDIVWQNGGVPATIGILNGVLKVGLSNTDIAELSQFSSDKVKTSRRDLPYVASKMISGGTTVSATIIAANFAGIKIFVTGGIGGVHRDGEHSLDISADLTELGRNRITVVCGGVKSILDIERTMEYLETQGVCVVTFGTTRRFPAFYTRESGHNAPYNVDSVSEAATLVQSLEDLRLDSGLLIAVPVPKSEELTDHKTMEDNITTAIRLAKENFIKGKELTPFILSQVASLTKGLSLQTNIALIKNNAKIGTQIAAKFCKNRTQNKVQYTTEFINYKTKISSPIVFGGSIVDSVISILDTFKVDGCTLQGRINQYGGGVGRNLADALGKLNMKPKLVSAVGDDLSGKFLLTETLGHVDCQGVMRNKEKATARYTALIDNKGDFLMGIGDMDIHDSIVPGYVEHFLTDCPMVLFDGNIPLNSIQLILEFCQDKKIPVMFEPTDVAKAAVPFQTDLWKTLNIISPNLKELMTIASFLGYPVNDSLHENNLNTVLQEVVRLSVPLAVHIQTILVTLGPLGIVVVGRQTPEDDISARYYSANLVENVVSASGAGDCVAAGIICGKLSGLKEPECIGIGLAAATDSLKTMPAVPKEFKTSPEAVKYTDINVTLPKLNRSFNKVR